MAEPKTKGSVESKPKGVNGTNGNHASEKSPVLNKQSKLWQLLTLAKEVTKDVDAIQNYENAIEGRKALEQDLETRTAEVQMLRELNDKILKEFNDFKSQANTKSQGLVAEFEQRYKAYESDKAAFETMEREVAEMGSKLEAAEATLKAKASENEKLKRQLKTADADAKSHAAEMKELNADCELHRTRMQTSISELDVCKTKLFVAQGDLGEDFLHDYGPEGLKNLETKLRDLSKKCHGVVMEYFNDQEVAEDAASDIEELKARFPKIPLSTMTTRPAAQMRCAVAEAVIAEVLTNQIFVPFYLPAPTRNAASILLDHFRDDERRQTIYRCQILRSMTDQEEIARVQDEIVRKASSEVRGILQGLVVSFKQGHFYNAIPTLFKEAQALWAEVQRSRDLITAEPADMNEAELPSKYDDYDQSSMGSPPPRGNKAAKAQIAAVLFPQVISSEGLVFNGMALWSNQAALAAAAQETSPNRTNGDSHKPGAGRRRSSVVSPDNRGRNRHGA